VKLEAFHMGNWVVKAIAQGVISLLPKSEVWHYQIQKHLTASAGLDEKNFEHKLQLASRQLAYYRQFAGKADFNVLELGTGYLPVVPIALHLCGAGKVRTVDKVRLLNLATTRETLSFFTAYAKNGRLSHLLPGASPARVEAMAGIGIDGSACVEQLLQATGVEYLVADARKLAIDGSSVDFIFSNAVLRDIPEAVLEEIFQEFYRVLAPQGVMAHNVVLEDHYSDYDRSISVYNFLKYPKWSWRLFNNSLHYQNRLRITDYRRLHDRTGFRILAQDDTIGPKEVLQSIRLAPEFRSYTPEDLAVVRSWMISTRSRI
jgi:SAM-dependent methyltransferase